jgi:predicted RNA-binding protein YlxR (DUF448 family)
LESGEYNLLQETSTLTVITDRKYKGRMAYIDKQQQRSQRKFQAKNERITQRDMQSQHTLVHIVQKVKE